MRTKNAQRNLYETFSSEKSFLKIVRNKMDFLAYSDGDHGISNCKSM